MELIKYAEFTCFRITVAEHRYVLLDQHKPHMTLEYDMKQTNVNENLYYFFLAMITVCC